LSIDDADINELSKQFVSNKQSELLIIGEVIDFIRWLGGYNLEFCWDSDYGCE
jgi:predicted flavoprotein YhiN